MHKLKSNLRILKTDLKETSPGFLIEKCVYISSFGPHNKYFGQVSFGPLLERIFGAHKKVLGRSKIVSVWKQTANFGDKSQSPEELNLFLQKRMAEYLELHTLEKAPGSHKQSYTGFHTKLTDWGTRALCAY
jgi:hypothetical protein